MINTHLIIGRLGSGKSSCVQHLIAQKPDNEVWAIVINEFGQIGLDAALIKPQTDNKLNITEVAGGCICCAAQSQLRVTLNKLIKQVQPDRIIIEATGLGHPAGIIDLLRDQYFKKIIQLNSVIAVLDLTLFTQPIDNLPETSPLKTQHFNQQSQLADIVVLNKRDLAPLLNTQYANEYLETIYPQKIKIVSSTHGEIDIGLLTIRSNLKQPRLFYLKPNTSDNSGSETWNFNQYAIECFYSASDEFLSFGFILPAEIRFSRQKLTALIKDYLSVHQSGTIRLKAILNCGKFWYSFNAINQQLEVDESFYRNDNRIELITDLEDADRHQFRELLLQCIVS